MTDYGACQTGDCRVVVFDGKRCPTCNTAGVTLSREDKLNWTILDEVSP